MNKPLAERVRPRTLDDYISQQHLVGPTGALNKQIRSGMLPSLILWGPPGTGKTTLAQIMADCLVSHTLSTLSDSYLRTTTTGLSAFVMNMRPFQIMSAEKTINARFSIWLRSCGAPAGECASFLRVQGSSPCASSCALDFRGQSIPRPSEVPKRQG